MLRKETCHLVWKIKLDLRTNSDYQTTIYTRSHGDSMQICFAHFSSICFYLFIYLLHYTYTIYTFICIVKNIKYKFVQSLIACTTTQTSQEPQKKISNWWTFGVLRTEKLPVRRACIILWTLVPTNLTKQQQHQRKDIFALCISCPVN